MKSKSYNLILLLLLIVTTFSACKKPDVIENPELLKSLYDNSQDTIKIGTSNYVLEAELYRNLMPGGPIVSERPLVALILLVNMDSIPIAANIQITKLYVINDQLIWVSYPVDSDQPQVPDFKLDEISKNGPVWATGIFVDVVAEILNNQTKEKYLLMAKRQFIMELV